MFSRITITVILYMTVLLLIFFYKPAMMFDAEGNIKHFDYDTSVNNVSLLSMEVILPIIALLCYFIVIIFELII